MLTAGPNVQVALVERFANSVSMNHRQTMTTGNTRSGDNDDDGSSASPAVVVEEPDATVVPPLPQQHGQQRQQGRGRGRLFVRKNYNDKKKAVVQDRMNIRVRAGIDPFSSLRSLSSTTRRRTCLFPDVKYLTIWNRGEHVDGNVITNVIDQCCRCNNENDNNRDTDEHDREDNNSTNQQKPIGGGGGGGGGAAAGVTPSSVLSTITIERRDNDWDSPNLKLRLDAQDDRNLALGLSSNSCVSSLQSFTITGLLPTSTRTVTTATAATTTTAGATAPTTTRQEAGIFHLSSITQALVELPNLKTVKFAADLSTINQQVRHPPDAGIISDSEERTYFTSDDLKLLLQMTSLTSLSLIGIIPESEDYIEVLQEAYVNNGCQTHIYLYFNGSNRSSSANKKKPSRFAYYIREIMELNQLGRFEIRDTNNVHGLIELLVHANGNRKKLNAKRRSNNGSNKTNSNKKKHSSFLSSLFQQNHHNHQPSTATSASLDSLYILIRENPWICDCVVQDDELEDSTIARGDRSNQKNNKKDGYNNTETTGGGGDGNSNTKSKKNKNRHGVGGGKRFFFF